MADTIHKLSSQWHIIDNRLTWLMDNNASEEHRNILITGIRKDLQELYERYEKPKDEVILPEKLTTKAPTQTTPQNSGFTGNFCSDCGGAKMVRTGTCEMCLDCGSTSGCS